MILPITVVWDFNPVFFSIGSFDIRYYGLMWVLAILGGMLFFDQVCKREGLPQKVSESIFVYGTLATILGARLGHCFFYEPGYFLAHPWAIITDFRNGGMASHGAAVGLLIGLWLFSRKINFLISGRSIGLCYRSLSAAPSSVWVICSIRRSWGR